MKIFFDALRLQLKSKPDLIPKIILGMLLFFSVTFNAMSLVLNPRNLINDWLVSFFQSLGTDFFGALITYLLLENIIGGWKEKLQEERLKMAQIEELEKKRFEQQVGAYQELRHSSTSIESQSIIDKMISLELLKSINLSETNLNNLHLINANLTKSKLEKTTFINSVLENCTFDLAYLVKVNFTSATLKSLSIKRAILVDTDFTNCIMPKSKFIDCTIQNGVFVNTKINEGVFDGTDISYADFSGANIEGASFVNANLRGANLRGARLYGSDFRGANLDEVLLDKHTTLPDGRQWTNDIDLKLYS